MNKIIAHRGVFDNKSVPENSMLSFKNAIKYNYPIELDVQLTKDNKLVVFHDDNLLRMTGYDKLLQEANYSEIGNLKLLNTNEKIPTFNEVLKLINNRVFLDIEVKNTKRVKETCDLLMKELINYSNYSIKSFNPFIVRFIKKNYPSVRCGYLISSKYNKRILFLFKSNFFIKYSMCDFLSLDKKLLKKDKIKNLSSKYPLQVWTIKKKEDVNYIDNVAYICNNLPFIK